ncbi:MAG: hypothetical protein QXV17_11995 [Candidatus Micrarchaeaceae archaeon]
MPRKKWGKIGAPHSAKRRAWMRHVANQRKKYYEVHLKRRGRERLFIDGRRYRARRSRRRR